jgi:hypothetical protein
MPKPEDIASWINDPALNDLRFAVKEVGKHWAPDLCLRCEEVWKNAEIRRAWRIFVQCFTSLTSYSGDHGEETFLLDGLPFRGLAQAEVSLQRFKVAATNPDGEMSVCYERLLPQVEKGWRYVFSNVSGLFEKEIDATNFLTPRKELYSIVKIQSRLDGSLSWATGLPTSGPGCYRGNVSKDSGESSYKERYGVLQSGGTVLSEWFSVTSTATDQLPEDENEGV